MEENRCGAHSRRVTRAKVRRSLYVRFAADALASVVCANSFFGAASSTRLPSNRTEHGPQRTGNHRRQAEDRRPQGGGPGARATGYSLVQLLCELVAFDGLERLALPRPALGVAAAEAAHVRHLQLRALRQLGRRACVREVAIRKHEK